MACLSRAGHEAVGVDAHDPDPMRCRPEAVVVAGGDGSVHHVLGNLSGTGVPLYHLPLGTANLFARQFGMGVCGEGVVRALEAMRTRDIDLLEINGRPAAVMMSMGTDAAVVHRLAHARRGPIRTVSYVGPFLAELSRWMARPIRVEADGGTIVDGVPGVVVVANMRHYGGGFDPARHADPADGLIDVVFLPAPTPAALVRMAVLARLGLHLGREGVVMVRARRVRVEGDGVPAQVDGEAIEHPGRIDVSVRVGALRVLLPGERAARPL
jgi:diacylglycerol kinase (ATP)